MKVIDFKDAKCRHCYKCVRNCAVKAISVKDEQARDYCRSLYQLRALSGSLSAERENICKRSGKSERIFGTRV